MKKNNLTAVLCFIDFKKAFDSINRGIMLKILKAYRIPPNLLRVIEAMYKGTRAKVVTPDGISEEFEILAGVQQGDTLAPFLFVIALDYALRKAINGREQDLGFTITPRRSSRIPAVALADLDYADDICLLSDRVKQAQELLNRVEVECAKVGLRLNAKKTEVMTYNFHKIHPPITTSDGNALREVNDFKHFGSWMNSTEQDLKARKALLAWRALNGMSRVWCSDLPRHKTEPIPRHCRVRPPVWLRKLDSDTHPAEVPGWVLHQNATSCSECGTEHPHHQQGPVRATAEAQQEGSS